MRFRLGLFIGAYLPPYVEGKGPEGRYTGKQQEENDKKNDAEKLKQQRGAAGDKQQQEKKQEAAAAAGLFMLPVYHFNLLFQQY
jgi:hypothetical protein